MSMYIHMPVERQHLPVTGIFGHTQRVAALHKKSTLGMRSPGQFQIQVRQVAGPVERHPHKNLKGSAQKETRVLTAMLLQLVWRR